MKPINQSNPGGISKAELHFAVGPDAFLLRAEEMTENKPEPCACIGPKYGDPHCLCEMERLGLNLNEAYRDSERMILKEHWGSFIEKSFVCGPCGPERNDDV